MKYIRGLLSIKALKVICAAWVVGSLSLIICWHHLAQKNHIEIAKLEGVIKSLDNKKKPRKKKSPYEFALYSNKKFAHEFFSKLVEVDLHTLWLNEISLNGKRKSFKLVGKSFDSNAVYKYFNALQHLNLLSGRLYKMELDLNNRDEEFKEKKRKKKANRRGRGILSFLKREKERLAEISGGGSKEKGEDKAPEGEFNFHFVIRGSYESHS